MLKENFFQSKSILVVCPDFFGYANAIKDKLTGFGSSVTVVDDRPSNSFLVKGLIRINKNLLQKTIDKYYEAVLSDISEKKFDIIFLLNPEGVTTSFLDECKSRWKDAYYIMYMWDSVKNRVRSSEYFSYCDRILTFDKNDALSYGFMFRPLFYLDTYGDIQKSHPNDYLYDLSFMATTHSDRYLVAKNVKSWCESKDLKCFFYFYIHGNSLYLYNKFIRRDLMPSMKDISFDKLSPFAVSEIVSSSRVILDIQHPNQAGLTMRTLEAIGAGKKLITTNANIREYDFYDDRQIKVIDRSNPAKILDLEFFLHDATPVNSEIVSRYSLESWLLDVFT
jgi:hypothetical protein